MEIPDCHGCIERDNRIAQLEARVLELVQLESKMRELEASVLQLNERVKQLTRRRSIKKRR